MRGKADVAHPPDTGLTYYFTAIENVTRGTANRSRWPRTARFPPLQIRGSHPMGDYGDRRAMPPGARAVRVRHNLSGYRRTPCAAFCHLGFTIDGYGVLLARVLRLWTRMDGYCVFCWCEGCASTCTRVAKVIGRSVEGKLGLIGQMLPTGDHSATSNFWSGLARSRGSLGFNGLSGPARYFWTRSSRTE